MRLVLDTNVVASALLWNGTPRQLFQTIEKQRITLYTSTPLLAELTNILERRKFEKKIAASGLTIDELVDHYAAICLLVRPQSVPPISLNPDDDVVIGTALSARADLIVSGDSHLLDLNVVESIPIVTVTAAIERISRMP